MVKGKSSSRVLRTHGCLTIHQADSWRVLEGTLTEQSKAVNSPGQMEKDLRENPNLASLKQTCFSKITSATAY